MVHGLLLRPSAAATEDDVSTFDIAAGTVLIEALTSIGVSAAEIINQKRAAAQVHRKADGSPVTDADHAADAIIHERLLRLTPALPIVSEERENRTATAQDYYLVDPLDGTREFIAGSDEFTVNIGVVSDGAPILGVIVAPALGMIWRGVVGHSAERLRFSDGTVSEPEIIHTRVRPQGELIVMVSRSHLDQRTQAYVDDLPHTRTLASGSSLKFCRLAEGVADHYPRLGPTRDWDVAAGHAILVAAGGSVVDSDGADLVYGTPELRIPSFWAWGGPVPTEGAMTDAY
jgi:3'(2'), 5'-bisphosphate nucleotidase